MQTQSTGTHQAAISHPTTKIYLSDKQVAQRYEVSRKTVWYWAANNPAFPKPVKLSPGCTRWKLSDIEAWEAGKGGA